MMLEHRVLLLRAGASLAERSIVDGESGVPLGTARWRRENGRAWRHWFRRGIMEVREREDEPLVFTVRRAWSLFPRRDVRDADEQEVGFLSGLRVHDRFGRCVADFDNGVFRAPSQHILAELRTTTDGQNLTFGNDIAGEPFVKMLLLAAVLAFGSP